MNILEISKSSSAKTEFSVSFRYFFVSFRFFNTDVGFGFLRYRFSVTDSALVGIIRILIDEQDRHFAMMIMITAITKQNKWAM